LGSGAILFFADILVFIVLLTLTIIGQVTLRVTGKAIAHEKFSIHQFLVGRW
jgi:hypothetical protein